MAVAASSPPSSFFTLAAFALENHSAAANSARRYGHRGWNLDVLECRFARQAGSLRSRVFVVRAAFRGLRCALTLRPGARKLASTNDALPHSFGIGTFNRARS